MAYGRYGGPLIETLFGIVILALLASPLAGVTLRFFYPRRPAPPRSYVSEAGSRLAKPQAASDQRSRRSDHPAPQSSTAASKPNSARSAGDEATKPPARPPGRKVDETGGPPEGSTPPKRQLSPRERRVERAARTERVRSALRAVASNGCYVFDGLVTESAGLLDYLAVGPVSICAVIVRGDEGLVTADDCGELYLDGKPFEDDPRRQAEELADDVIAALHETDKPINYVICFSEGRIDDRGDPRSMSGVATLWTLAWTLTEDGECLNGVEIEELAETIQKLYGRTPFVTPRDEAAGDEA